MSGTGETGSSGTESAQRLPTHVKTELYRDLYFAERARREQIRGSIGTPSAALAYTGAGALLVLLVAAYLARSVVVTEYGIIHDINRISQAVAWAQVVDYFTVDADRGVRYVFFYTEEDDPQRHRLEVTVPASRAEAFHRLVEAKLNARFAFKMRELSDPEDV